MNIRAQGKLTRNRSANSDLSRHDSSNKNNRSKSGSRERYKTLVAANHEKTNQIWLRSSAIVRVPRHIVQPKESKPSLTEHEFVDSQEIIDGKQVIVYDR